MIKKIYFIIFSFFFLFTSNCSFDNKSGIWTNEQDERRRIAQLEKRQNNSDIEKLSYYSTENIYSKEINLTQKIKLSSPKKNLSWKTSGLNLQNFKGNIVLNGIENKFLKKKKGKNKFSISKLLTSPLVFENSIYISDDVGTIFKINEKGKLIWKVNIYDKVYKNIYKSLTYSIYKDNIYVADNIGFIYSISLSTGKLLWIKNHGVPIKSNLKIIDDKIIAINQKNRLLCFDANTGILSWDYRSISSFIKMQNYLGLAISKDKDVVALNSSGTLVKANLKSGQLYWTLNITSGMLVQDTDFFRSSNLVLTDDEIIFSALSTMFSINLSTGYTNWTQDVGVTTTPIVDGSNVFVVTENGYFINFDRETGNIISSTNILKALKENKQSTKITGFVMGSGKIYAITYNGYIIVCSPTSGKVDNFKKIGENVSSPPIISNGLFYILTENSKILIFN